MTNQEKFDQSWAGTNISINYPEDCQIIKKIAKEKLDIDMSLYQASEIWKWYSEEFYCAGWLSILSEESIIKGIDFWLNRYKYGT